jgi:hypothetical protein
MQESNAVESPPELGSAPAEDSVSTHVLVSHDQVAKLRELSRRTRVAQSEYLREAVDDLLTKYERGNGAGPGC